jgi:hypothetical protein
MSLDYGINSLWPTNVMLSKIEHEELLAEVCHDIFTDYNLNDMPSDFKKDYDILTDGSKALQEFKKLVVVPTFDRYLQATFGVKIEKFTKPVYRSWLARPHSGYHIATHNHSGSSISGVFYLMCDEKGRGGELVLLDPRTNANRGYIEDLRHVFDPVYYKPRSGESVLFPSYMYHQTTPFVGAMRLAMPVDFFPEFV